MFRCIDLIGMPYEYGADGTKGAIDCIHLVYCVLQETGITAPPFKESWYTAPKRLVVRDLLTWGYRVDRPTYDGEVLLIPQDRWAFAAVWNHGALHINRLNQRVAWCPLTALPTVHCFHTRNN